MFSSFSCYTDLCVLQGRPAPGRPGEAAPGEDSEESERALLLTGGPVCPAWSHAAENEDQVCMGTLLALLIHTF